MNTSLFWWLMLFITVLELVADVLFKYWSQSNRHYLFWIGLITYSIGVALWAYTLKFEGLIKSYVVYSMIAMISTVILGYFMFNEQLNIKNLVGICFAILSIILIYG